MRGNIGWLQNLLPLKDYEEPFSDLYPNENKITSVIPLDLKYLSYILAENEGKHKKLWFVLASRYIELNMYKLFGNVNFSHEKIKIFCKMCII